MLAAFVWLNNLYYTKAGEPMDGVNLSTPLTYPDRFRIRRPDVQMKLLPPHMDGLLVSTLSHDVLHDSR
jgi:hypothetical protein